MKPLDLIVTARHLAALGKSRRPRQADLRRALSTAYYAMFHLLCRTCADAIVGTASSDRSTPAWLQTYRAVDHGFAKNQCLNSKVLSKFPKEIEDFGTLFWQLQDLRHDADYNPMATFTRSEAKTYIEAADEAMRSFQKVPWKDRRAFAVWVLVRSRKS